MEGATRPAMAGGLRLPVADQKEEILEMIGGKSRPDHIVVNQILFP